MMMPSPLDPIWANVQLRAFGGIRGRVWGQEFRERNYSELVRRITITDSVHHACRVAEFEMDNSFADVLAPAHPGSHWLLWGHEYDPETGTATDWRELFAGVTYVDARSMSGDSAAVRRYRVYEFAGNVLARNDGTLVFDEGVHPGWKEGPTLSEVCYIVGITLGLTFTTIVDTEVRVGALVQSPGMSYWDVIEEAARRTLERTGRRYFVRASRDGKALDLLEFGNTGVVWKLNNLDAGILADLNFEESAEDMALSLEGIVEKVEDDEKNTRTKYSARAEIHDPEEPIGADLVTWFGRNHRVITPEGDYGQSDPEKSIDMPGIQAYVDQQLHNRARTVNTISTSSLLIPGVRRGDEVRIGSNRWQVSAAPFFVKSVVTTYEAGQMLQTMDLVYDQRDG